MPLNIPMPGSGADALESGLKTGSNFARNIMLTPAEAQAKQADAYKSQMMARLLKYAMGGEGAENGQDLQGDGAYSPNNTGGVDRRLLMKGLLGIPTETPEQERAGQAQKELNVAQGKENQKRMKEALDTVDILKRYEPNVETLGKILNKNKNAISISPSAAQMGVEDWGAFDAASTPLVGMLGKDISQRGGAVAARFAQAGKPSKFKFHGQNLGLHQGLVQAAINDYKNAKEKYEEASGGQPFPVQLPDYYKQFLDKDQEGAGKKQYETTTLTGGLIVPKKDAFGSDKEFSEWYNQQPKATKLAYRQYLQGKQ